MAAIVLNSLGKPIARRLDNHWFVSIGEFIEGWIARLNVHQLANNRLFGLHSLLLAEFRRILQERTNHVAPKSRFFDELEDHMSTDDAESTLRSVTAWGRYAEAFAYDDDTQTFSLENPT